jgi:acetyl-CoA C-acetyltransferase
MRSVRREARARRPVRCTTIHPQRILAQVLNALQAAQRLRHRARSTTSSWAAAPAAATTAHGHRADGSARRRLERSRASGVTLNRFCGSGQQAVNFAQMGVLAGFQDLVVSGGVEFACRATGTDARRRLHGQQPAPASTCYAHGAAGHLRRPHRDCSRASAARSCDRWRSTARTAPQRSDRGGPLRPCAGARSSTTTARWRSTATSTRVPVTTLERPGQAGSSRASPAMGMAMHDPEGFKRAEHRPDSRAKAYPHLEQLRTTCTTPATRRVWSTAPLRDCWSPRPDYARAHGIVPRARIRAMAAVAGDRAGHHAHRSWHRQALELPAEGRHDAISTTSTCSR